MTQEVEHVPINRHIKNKITSTGWHAQYCTHYTMCLETGKINTVVVLNKHQVGGSSPRMEPAACYMALQFLQQQGIKIE